MSVVLELPRLEIRAGAVQVNGQPPRPLTDADRELADAFFRWLGEAPAAPPPEAEPDSYERCWGEDR